jgi:uncharacterized membrane protein (UPF0127 family)
MKKISRKKLFLIGVMIGMICVIVVMILKSNHHTTNEILPISESISTPGGIISVRVAQTQAQQELGLSYIKSLPQNQGMLFPFKNPGIYPFWMKDMKFPLDMVWLKQVDLHRYIVDSVTENASVSSYPALFRSTGNIDAVLEINAYRARVFGLEPGSLVKLDK